MLTLQEQALINTSSYIWVLKSHSKGSLLFFNKITPNIWLLKHIGKAFLQIWFNRLDLHLNRATIFKRKGNNITLAPPTNIPILTFCWSGRLNCTTLRYHKEGLKGEWYYQNTQKKKHSYTSKAKKPQDQPKSPQLYKQITWKVLTVIESLLTLLREA